MTCENERHCLKHRSGTATARHDLVLPTQVGNAFTSGVNFFIQNPDGSSRLEGPDYYWFFTAIMLLTAFIFIGVAKLYRGQSHIQGESTKPEA